MTKPIVTRFAPSPTGYLHIGGARTALFNFLFAKQNGGHFKLRIEDTDKERNTPEAIEAIFASLDWLGLFNDGNTVYQSQNADRHVEVANELLARGMAYRCYVTQEEIAAQRQEAKDKKRPFKFVSPYRNSPDMLDMPYVVRMRMPEDGETTITDFVQGEVTVKNSVLDDYVLLRADGTPTYMLAVVVDDHDMGVTHVIRGDDHLNNAFRQLPIYDAMGWERPEYAHVPLILNEKGEKLSKRNGDAGTEDYALRGIPADAMFNYLLRMGWGSGDHEIISPKDAIRLFSLDGVGKAPSRLDDKRLLHLSSHYIQNEPIESLAERINDEDTGSIFREKLAGILRERSRTYKEFDDYVKMVLDAPEGVEITGDPLAFYYLSMLSNLLIQTKDEDFTPEKVREHIEEIARVTGMKLRKVVEPIRLAIFGQKVSPPLFEVMPLMGRQECGQRLVAALKGLLDSDGDEDADETAENQ